jgi:hypothetical protein
MAKESGKLDVCRGCRGFIRKPFSIKDLSLKIREILD